MPSLKVDPKTGQPHIHSYMRRAPNPKATRTEGSTYMCTHPQCTHYLPKSDLKGKLSLCPKCMRNTLILDSSALKLVTPLCIHCRGTKEASEVKKLVAQLKELGID